MSTERTETDGIEGFFEMRFGEIYHLVDRRVIPRGFRYFNSLAVEALTWDPGEKRIGALVAGSRIEHYQVWMRVRGGNLEHQCNCPAWSRSGGCKHFVAAFAAVMAVLKRQPISGLNVPEDYLDELSLGLEAAGLSAAGRKQSQGNQLEQGQRKSRKKVLKVTSLSEYGGMSLRSSGPIPSEFYESAGLETPYSYGFSEPREFFLRDLEADLKPFLRAAAKAGISVRFRGPEGTVELRMARGKCKGIAEYVLQGRAVKQRLRFEGPKQSPLDPIDVMGAMCFILNADGAIYEIANADDLDPYGEIEEAPLLAEQFNRGAVLAELPTGVALKKGFRFRVEADEIWPIRCKADEVTLQMDCSLWRNAAGEGEYWEFAISLQVGTVRVDLDRIMQLCLRLILTAYSGGLLSAKRRVVALLDLIRRLLADYEPSVEFDLSQYALEFEELFSPNYRNGVLEILNSFGALIRDFDMGSMGLAADVEDPSFLAYPVPLRRILMLLLSLSVPGSRRDLHALEEGQIAIRRGSSGTDALKQMLRVAQELGVQMRVDELPVRSKPLSISVDVKAGGKDIDWFALHPSIACGERTIQPDEWLQLIRGDVLLRDEDGALILPELAAESESSLRAIASMLRVDPVSGRVKPEAEQVPRLQMLDWIALRKHGVKLRMPDEAEQLFTSLMETNELPAFNSPASFKAKLRAYQAEGCSWIEFLYKHRFGACLADDMGLGKTVQAIGFIAACFDREFSSSRGTAPVLIVLPPSLVFNWLDEWARFAPSIKVVDCLTRSDWEKSLAEADVVLTTYDRVRIDISLLQEHRFEVVVFDEAHNLKSASAARTKAAARLQRRFTLCLTGTPVENNASEFYSVLSAAVPGIFGSLKQFKQIFREDPDRILGRSRPFILRRTKREILNELPKKEESVLHLEMSPVQKEMYTRTVAEVRAEVADAYQDRPEQQAGIVALAAILRLRQVCVSPALIGKELPEPAPKLAYLADKLVELQAEGNAALVFSQFIGGLDQMEAVARANGIEYLRMDGKTPVADRKGIVHSFQSGEGPPFFFISLKTGGVGLNLTRANYVFHLDPWWNPAVENQASDRAHRIGQKRSVFVQRLIMGHSIEARMMELKERKADLFRQLVETPGAKVASAGLSRADFDYLLND